MTYDGGQTWTTSTPPRPTRSSGAASTCNAPRTRTSPTTTSAASANLLDFNDITVDSEGRPLIAFADGCTGNRVTDSTVLSQGAAGTVMRLTSGKGLYATYDAVPSPKKH